MTDVMAATWSTTKREVREQVLLAAASGKTTGVVMTMGALHDGHLSLVEACAAECDFVVVTIFVNPTQFLPGEDFAKYPRTLDEDRSRLTRLPVDLIFCPGTDEMYGEGFSTYIEPPEVANSLEGICRPGHFRGVCTVVFKLLQAVPAQRAYFGRKDYQQFVVIRQMARDLDLSTQVVSVPTVRESDGLAMSSRNRYLDTEQRRQATAISRGLEMAAELVQSGNVDAGQVAARIRQELVTSGVERIDYVSIAHPDTLEEVPQIEGTAIALVAAHVGDTRLIDNRFLTCP